MYMKRKCAPQLDWNCAIHVVDVTDSSVIFLYHLSVLSFHNDVVLTLSIEGKRCEYISSNSLRPSSTYISLRPVGAKLFHELMLEHCWLDRRNKLKWILDRILCIWNQENLYENVVCNMAVICLGNTFLFQYIPQYCSSWSVVPTMAFSSVYSALVRCARSWWWRSGRSSPRVPWPSTQTVTLVTTNTSRMSLGKNIHIDRKISSIRRTKSQNLNDSRLVFHLSLPNLLKPGVK